MPVPGPAANLALPRGALALSFPCKINFWDGVAFAGICLFDEVI